MSNTYNFYKVGEANFEFVTDFNLCYQASFADASAYFPAKPEFANVFKAFGFQVIDNPLQKIPSDARVGDTILAIIVDFFEEHHEAVLFFIHESADGKELGRKRKFDTWYRKAPHLNLVKKDAEIPWGRFSILASILFAANHPLHDSIVLGFEQVVMEATIKPED